METKKIIIATESQHSWYPSEVHRLNKNQIEELRQYLPTPKQSVALMHLVSQAASIKGIDVEHIVIEDIDTAINKLRLSATDSSCVWVVSDGRIFHSSGAICAWLRNLGIAVFGIDTAIQSLTDNKYLMTVIAERHGLLVPHTMLYKGHKQLATLPGFESNNGYFVKPNTLGSQVGISSNSHVSNLAQAGELAELLYNNYGVDCLIQSYIDGTDFRVPVIETSIGNVELDCFSVSILNEKNQAIEFSTNRIESNRKWHLTKTTTSSAPFQSAAYIVKLFYQLGLVNGYSAIDVRGSKEDGYFFLENNVKPFIDSSFEGLAAKLDYTCIGEMFVDTIIQHNRDSAR